MKKEEVAWTATLYAAKFSSHQEHGAVCQSNMLYKAVAKVQGLYGKAILPLPDRADQIFNASEQLGML